eukprot:650179-Pleurochrysis_carterae.AAC.1
MEGCPWCTRALRAPTPSTRRCRATGPPTGRLPAPPSPGRWPAVGPAAWRRRPPRRPQAPTRCPGPVAL